MKTKSPKELEIINEIRETSFEDIHYFAEEFLPHIVTKDIPPFHDEIYRCLPNNKRILIAAPRGFGKSKLSSVIYPIWLACIGDLAKDLLIISASETLAKELLRQIKTELSTNTKLHYYFGEFRTEKWSETHIITKTGVAMMVRGAGSQIRGFRPDCVILDDIETDETVESEELRRKLKSWLMKACIPTIVPSGQLVMVGSMISRLCLLNDLYNTNNDWVKLRYQAYIDGEEIEGKELWPELWPHAKLVERKQEIGSWAFSAEYMNNPISNTQSPIKEEMIRNWSIMPENLSLVIALDPAYSEDEKSDYKVAVLVGIDQQDRRYLIRYIRTRDSIGDYMDAVLNMWSSYKQYITGVGIPNSGTEKSFYDSFIKFAEARNLYPPVTPLKNSFLTAAGQSVRKKTDRIIAALQPIFERGKYYIHETHLEARDELLTIGQSIHDDLTDAMAYAEQILVPKFYGTSYEEKEEFFQNNNIGINYGID